MPLPYGPFPRPPQHRGLHVIALLVMGFVEDVERLRGPHAASLEDHGPPGRMARAARDADPTRAACGERAGHAVECRRGLEAGPELCRAGESRPTAYVLLNGARGHRGR